MDLFSRHFLVVTCLSAGLSLLGCDDKEGDSSTSFGSGPGITSTDDGNGGCVPGQTIACACAEKGEKADRCAGEKSGA